MRSRRLLGLVLVLASSVATAKPIPKAPKASNKTLPKQLSEVKNVKLGEPVATFMADFSEEERDTTVHGLRIFTVKPNTLPVGVANMRCEFLDGKLVYVGIQLDGKTSTSQTWTTFVGPIIAQYGAPKSAMDLLGISRLHGARLDESAGWSDANVALIYGRDATEPHPYLVALVDAKYVQQAGAAIQSEDADETAAAKKVQDDARRKRDADAAEAKRVQDAQDAEARRAQAAKDAATKQALADKDAEVKRLREAADKAKQANEDEARRLKDDAEKAKRELQALKATQEQELARKAEEDRKAKVLADAISQFTASASACSCAGGNKVRVRCHVHNDADVAVRVMVKFWATAIHNNSFSSDDATSVEGQRSISLPANFETDMEIDAAVTLPDEGCTSISDYGCGLVKLVVAE